MPEGGGGKSAGPSMWHSAKVTGGSARQKLPVRGVGKAGGETTQCVETTEEEFVLFVF